ncbi:MAG: DISARM system phospholipase D-like protein DrmC [Hydrococcus sp. Prado102]|jgi:phosphatidylserine/phosphatidylglycerophosphate/cardiolipin synthase-like enzyme|nr:DISARM system phospholipase D-like protein DrmC [Hydrococcus sp. Prado102]
MSPFLTLSRPALLGLAEALETGRLTLTIAPSSLAPYLPLALCQIIATEFDRLHRQGTTAYHLAYTLRLLAAERERTQTVRDRVELVWTGPEGFGTQSRDTKVVVQELFNSAKSSVLLSSFAIERGKKAFEIFKTLANRMDANPALEVRMFLNIQRPYQSQVAESVLLREFTETFRDNIWTGRRLPEVFYDSRSLALTTNERACLHAKCVIVDDEKVFVTSANFTEAARDRNIEAGILLTDSTLASALRSQFDSLIAIDILRRVPGL